METKKDNRTFLLAYLTAQLKLGFSPLVLFVGRQRVGKTALALSVASMIEPSFNIKEQMTYRIEDFVTAYDKFNKKIIILDEAGVPLDPYEHASITQRVYSHIVQTQAYKQNMVFLVLPHASEIGKNHRKHVSAIVYVIWRGCYKLYATNSWNADLSQKPPRLTHIETIMGVPLPPKKIWDYYIECGQKEYKQSIMDMQKLALQVRSKKMLQSSMGQKVYRPLPA